MMDTSDNKPALPGLDQVDIERIQAALLGLTQYHRLTKKQVVREQYEAIEAALGRGVGYAAVAAVLTAGGCAINPEVLRKYLSQIRKECARSPSRASQEDRRSQPGRELGAAEESSLSPNVPSLGTADRPEGRRSLRRSTFLSLNTTGSKE